MKLFLSYKNSKHFRNTHGTRQRSPIYTKTFQFDDTRDKTERGRGRVDGQFFRKMENDRGWIESRKRVSHAPEAGSMWRNVTGCCLRSFLKAFFSVCVRVCPFPYNNKRPILYASAESKVPIFGCVNELGQFVDKLLSWKFDYEYHIFI